jgi:diaminopimelate decarboxylase
MNDSTRTTLINAAAEHGSPLYLYDLNRVAENYRRLFQLIQWPSLGIFYAMKANYNFHLLQTLNHEGAGIDAVSPAEVQMALKAGFPVDRILYTANNMTESEIREVHETGVLMNIDTLSTLEKYGRMFPGSDVCVRFNPDVKDGENEKIMTGGNLTKFGILLDDADQVQEIASRYALKVRGLHEHTGSGLQMSESVFKSMENIMAVATPARFPDLKFLDFGGGFKVTVRPGEVPFDYESMGIRITEMFARFCKGYGRDIALYFEPGKYLVSDAGYFIMAVNTVKNNRGRVICGTNAGFPQLIRPTLYNAYHHVENLTHPEGEKMIYDICGNICETGDLFAEQREVSHIREGDLLLLKNAGAYCYSMGGIYNMRPMPAEVVLRGERVLLSRKRMTARALVEQILLETV